MWKGKVMRPQREPCFSRLQQRLLVLKSRIALSTIVDRSDIHAAIVPRCSPFPGLMPADDTLAVFVCAIVPSNRAEERMIGPVDGETFTHETDSHGE